MARPSKTYDPEVAAKVQAMSQYGVSQIEIANLCGLSPPTLRKLYVKELAQGSASANVAVGKKLFERCMAGDIAALIFWAKTRMGWREIDKSQVKSDSNNATKQLTDAIRKAMNSVG